MVGSGFVVYHSLFSSDTSDCLGRSTKGKVMKNCKHNQDFHLEVNRQNSVYEYRCNLHCGFTLNFDPSNFLHSVVYYENIEVGRVLPEFEWDFKHGKPPPG